MLSPQFRICAVAFLIDFAVMVLAVALPFFVYNQLGLGAGTSGALGGAQAAAYALSCLASSGMVSRARNAMHWTFGGLVSFLLFASLIPLYPNVWFCGVMAVASSASLGPVWPALHSWIGAEPDLVKRGRIMAIFNISWSFGFAISPLLAGPLYDMDYRWPFVLFAGTVLLALILVRTLPHEKSHFAAPSQEMLEERAHHDRASESHLYATWCATLIGSLLTNVTRTVFPKRIDELVNSHQLRFLWEQEPCSFLTTGAATKYSWLAFVLALVSAGTFFWMGRSRWWHHRFSVLAGLQMLAAASFIVLGTTSSLVLMLACFVIVGANSGVSFFAAIYYSLANPEHRRRRVAINEFSIGLGGFVGSICFGSLVAKLGMAMPFYLTPGVVGLAFLVELWLIQYGARSFQPQPAIQQAE